MKPKYKILEPVYLTRGKKTGYRLLLAVEFGNSFGLFSIALDRQQKLEECKEPIWCFKFCRSKGRNKLKLNKSISLFKDQLVTPENWKPTYIQCSISKIKDIKAWIDHMNHLIQERTNG